MEEPFDRYEIWLAEAGRWDGFDRTWDGCTNVFGFYRSKEDAIRHLGEVYGAFAWDLDWKILCSFGGEAESNLFEALGYRNGQAYKFKLERIGGYDEPEEDAPPRLWRSMSHKPPWENDEEEFRRSPEPTIDTTESVLNS